MILLAASMASGQGPNGFSLPLMRTTSVGIALYTPDADCASAASLWKGSATPAPIMLMMREKWRREIVPEARLNNASIPGKLA